jgi:hypothetical protein
MAGYSGKSLAAKLGLKEGAQVFLVNAPDAYAELVAPLPQGVEFVRRLTKDTDLIHIFATERARLSYELESALLKIRPDAVIWVSWPKKASKVATDITEDTVRAVALPLGLVDVKVCAVDETWSGLKLVLRRENRRRL